VTDWAPAVRHCWTTGTMIAISQTRTRPKVCTCTCTRPTVALGRRATHGLGAVRHLQGAQAGQSWPVICYLAA
jgi:hypothetical protein